MGCHRRSFHAVALTIVVALPLLGTSGVATANAKTVGCHKTHSCKSGSGGGSGAGANPAPIMVQIDPNPLVETGQSVVTAIVQVETSPSLAGDTVNVSSTQLLAACAGGLAFEAFPLTGNNSDSAQVTLDDDGNATVNIEGNDCAPGPSLVEADLAVAPYYTALGTLNAEPPVVTTPGLFGYPTTSGTVAGGEVETGDAGPNFHQSDVLAVFYVETDPVYAEAQVEISSAQLQARCEDVWSFRPLNQPGSDSFGVGNVLRPASPATATATLDDDGNAVFLFEGASCAAGSSVVTADVLAGDHPTYTATFNVLPPQPTI